MSYDSEMVIVTVVYPKSAASRFDFDYYLATHVPLVKGRLADKGLEDLRVMRGTGTLDGGAPSYEVIAQLFFPSMQHIQNSLESHGPEILGDIPKFTNIQPVIQINEPL